MIYTFRQKWWNTIIKRNNSVRETGEQLRFFYCTVSKIKWMNQESIRMSSLGAELIWTHLLYPPMLKWSSKPACACTLPRDILGKTVEWVTTSRGTSADCRAPAECNYPGLISWLLLCRGTSADCTCPGHISWSQDSWPCPSRSQNHLPEAYQLTSRVRGTSADCRRGSGRGP
jgi:hypothetical protein